VRQTDRSSLSVIANTADDEEFLGLHVSPDIDTILYTLTGRADPVRGWGRKNESFTCLEEVGRLGAPTWFRLGDRDLAVHLLRTERLRAGWPLSRVTAHIAKAFALAPSLIPMTDDAVRTFVHTERGRLSFQTYLVRGAARGRVRRIELAGARTARPAPGVLRAIARARAIVLAPSNPLVSIGPILAVPAVRAALRARRARSAAVCPLVGGRPLRGPLHRMMRGLGLEVSPLGVARLYLGLVDLFVIDGADAAFAPALSALGFEVLVTDTIMRTPADAMSLAGAVLRALRRRG